MTGSHRLESHVSFLLTAYIFLSFSSLAVRLEKRDDRFLQPAAQREETRELAAGRKRSDPGAENLVLTSARLDHVLSLSLISVASRQKSSRQEQGHVSVS